MTDKQGVDMPERTCSIPNCARLYEARGWCNLHYTRWRKYGDPLAGGTVQRPYGLTEAEAFAWFMPGDPPHTNSLTDGCWDWTAAVFGPNGYGIFTVNGISHGAHVTSHRIYNPTDPISVDKPYVLHSCDRRICVQPAHLHAGTQAENLREARERNRTSVGMPGEKSARAKLTEAEVIAIRQSTLSRRTLGSMFGVSKATIDDICSGRSWKHLV